MVYGSACYQQAKADAMRDAVASSVRYVVVPTRDRRVGRGDVVAEDQPHHHIQVGFPAVERRHLIEAATNAEVACAGLVVPRDTSSRARR